MAWIPITDPPKIVHPIPSHYPVIAPPLFHPFISLPGTFLSVLPLKFSFLRCPAKNNKNSCEILRGPTTLGSRDVKIGGDVSHGSHGVVAPMLGGNTITAQHYSACLHCCETGQTNSISSYVVCLFLTHLCFINNKSVFSFLRQLTT